MINASNAFKKSLYDGHRNYLEYVDITLKDGTELHLTNKDLWQGGMKFEDSVSSSDVFDVGAAIINKCDLTINNITDEYSDYDFYGASVVTFVGLQTEEDVEEKLQKGTFSVDEAKYNGSIITLSCLDNMSKFDRPYSESTLTFPVSIERIVQDACETCDVLLRTASIPHGEYVVQSKPSEESTTFRDVISWVAQIAGCFARCDVYGRLELKWYDQELLEKQGYDGGIFDSENPSKYVTGDTLNGGSFNPWDSGDSADGGTFKDMQFMHHIYSHYSAPEISTDDVVITGVRVIEKVESEDNAIATATYLRGTEGYVIEISENDLIQGGGGEQISNWLGEQLIGFRFRKASLHHASDPTIEAGDVGIVTNRKGQSFPIIISSTRFSTGGSQETESSAATPARNSSTRFSAETKNYVDFRKQIQNEKTSREKAIEMLSTELANSNGLYMTTQVQPGGSTIYYMHNKPSLGESMIVWKMTAEAFGVSTDGGQTYPVGIDATGMAILTRIYTIGLNADHITTGAFEIKRDDGTILVLMDKDTKQVILRPDMFELSDGSTIDSIAEDKAATAANAAQSNAEKYADTAASSAVNDFVNKTYDPKIAELQKQLDGQIESHYYDYLPTLSNAPADAWTNDTEKQKHEGDLFFWKSKGYAYRFLKEGTTWEWKPIQDTDITKALAEAATAQDTADKKRRTFLVQPTPPYDEGDLWYGGTDKDVLVCKKSRQSGDYDAGDWGKADRYIDQATADTAAANAVNGQTQEDIFKRLTDNGKAKGIILKDGQLYVSATYMNSGAINISKGDVETFYANVETGEVRIKAKSFSLESGETIDSIAEGKANEAANSALGSANSYTDTIASSTLKSAQDYANSAASTAASNAVNAQTQSDIFNRLTNNGISRGLYLEGGQLYMSFDYARGGTLVLGGENNGNGTLKILNASGTEIGRWNNNGIYINGGEFYAKSSTSTASLRGGRTWYTHGGVDVGYITATEWKTDSTKKGIEFELYPDGAFMAWAAKKTTGDNLIVKLMYQSKNIDDLLADTLYAHVPMVFRDRVYFKPTSTLIGIIKQYTNMLVVSGGMSSPIRICQETSADGSTDSYQIAKFSSEEIRFFSTTSKIIHVFNNIDMHNYDIQNSSDERIKDNIEESNIHALDVINSMKTYSFDWVENGEHTDLGFVAQQLEAEVDADFVDVNEQDGHYSTKELNMIPYLVKSIQELSEEVQELKEEMRILKCEKPLFTANAKTVSAARKKEWTPTNYTLEEKMEYVESIKPNDDLGEEIHPEEVILND